MYKRFFKRIIDIILSIIGLVIASPILLLVIIMLLISHKSIYGVFFFQDRPGKDSKIYKVIKFKTMNDKKNTEGCLLSDAERLTVVGKFVRSLSIDELPQLINVLKGDMSLVGPRPLMVKYLPLYSQEQARRHEVRPGITGWAQINGRNNILWKKKFELDLWYVDHIVFLLDCKILFLTVLKVFKREGVSKEGEATTEAFNGNN